MQLLPCLASQPLEVVAQYPWEQEFFAQYAATRSLHLACKTVSLSRDRILDIKASNPVFAHKMYQAELDHFDILYVNALQHAKYNGSIALKLAEAQVSWLAPKPPPKQVVEVYVKEEPEAIMRKWDDMLGIANWAHLSTH